MIRTKLVRYSDMKDRYQCAVYASPENDPVIYQVEEYEEVNGTRSAMTWLHSGTTAGEFYMTRGHRHEKNTGETYRFLHGHGLLYMFQDPYKPDVVAVVAGDIITIPKGYAHRVINTGDDDLVFLSTYDVDAGHDYDVDFRLHFGGEPT